MRCVLAGFVWSLCTFGVSAQAPVFNDALSPLSDLWPAELPSTALSISVKSLTEAQPAEPGPWDHLPRQSRAPASVMKLITAYAALTQLGPAFRWETELLLSSAPKDGRLTTPLYVRASGDPSLSVARLWQALSELRRQGVIALDAGVVIDRSRYGDVAIDPGAFDEAAERPYNASPDAFLIGWGSSELILRFDVSAGRWHAALDPLPAGARLEAEIKPVPGPCSDPAGLARKLEIQAPAKEDAASAGLWVVRGALPAACGRIDQYRLLLSPARQAEAHFKRLWAQLGGTLRGGFRPGTVPTGAEPWVRTVSEPLSDVLKPMLKYSNNVMARQVLLALDPQDGAQPARAARHAHNILKTQGLDLPSLVLDNGSGLSRRERLTADELTQLLANAWRAPWMPEYLAALPVWGVDGTLAGRAPGAAAGRARLKTGALDDVRALAGYIPTAGGQWLAVAIIVNHPQAETALPFMRALVGSLAASH